MTVTPMLGDWEIPRIAFMRSEEARKLAEFPIPGRAGNAYQDLNLQAATIEIAGSLYQEEERTGFVEEVRARFQSGEPLTFVSDIVQATDIQFVLIESLVLEEHGTRPGEIAYRMVLRESPPPPPPGGLLDGIDTGLLDDAAGFIDSVTDALDALDALGDIPDFSDPSALLGGTTDEALAAVAQLGSVGPMLQDLFGSSS